MATRFRQSGLTAHTLDGDASQIVAEKAAAQFTYKGEQGYMPMIGHLAEAGIVIFDEFREGNISPATQNLEFVQACEARLPKRSLREACRATPDDEREYARVETGEVEQCCGGCTPIPNVTR